jgi:CubicO group peptidase (beta-lactamase class C family)
MKAFLIVLIALCSRLIPLMAQEETLRFERALKGIDELVERTMQENKVPGIAVALTNRVGLLHVSSYGFANMDARNPVTPETLFGIGSIGKSFTAVAVLQLRDEGKLDLHGPLTDYLPWFKINSTVPITAHHLLTHTAGIPHMRMELTSNLYQAYWLTEAPVRFEPGKQYHYSSTAWDILSVLIEELGHQPYYEFLQRRILGPLGMNHSEPVFRHQMRPRLAVSYEPLFDDRPSHTSQPLVESNWFEYGGGAGSVAASAEDLAAYLRMLLNRGSGPSQRVLSEESFRLLTQRTVNRSENHYYGYGLEVIEEQSHTLIGHGGGVQGFRSMMLGDLDDGLGVIVLSNGPADLNVVAEFALKAARAALHNQELPSLPAMAPATKLINAVDYAGTYVAMGGRKLEILADQDKLILECNGQTMVLEKRGPDRFFCNNPDFDLFLIQFGRENGVVVEADHGSEWYVNERYKGPRKFDYPPEWNTYPGHYRTATRHHINFRIVLRKGKLWFISPDGQETLLVPTKDGFFRISDSPEWLHFDTVVGGKTLRVNYSGTDFHRDFTP